MGINNSLEREGKEDIEEIIRIAVENIVDGFKHYPNNPTRIILREGKHSEFFRKALEARLNLLRLNNPEYQPEIIISDTEKGYVIDVNHYLRIF